MARSPSLCLIGISAVIFPGFPTVSRLKIAKGGFSELPTSFLINVFLTGLTTVTAGVPEGLQAQLIPPPSVNLQELGVGVGVVVIY